MNQHTPLHRKRAPLARRALSGALLLAWAALVAAPWYLVPALHSISVPVTGAHLVALAISAVSVIAMAAYHVLRLLRARHDPPPLHIARPGRFLELTPGEAAQPPRARRAS